MDFDVVIVGAGPAGATAAINLAPARSVLLVDFRPFADSGPGEPVGESLAPAARQLLTDMGLFQSFVEQGHAPCYGNRSVWGGTHPVETDFLRDPDGHGWHLDRNRFDAWLRSAAVHRGATLLAPARLQTVARQTGRWNISFTTREGPQTLRARFLIDAGGRFAPLARRLGAKRQIEDALICSWTHGLARSTGSSAGFTFIEGVEDGWWYTAPLPGGRRILAFHTDSDLPAARVARAIPFLIEKSRAAPALTATLEECGFSPGGRVRMMVASGGMLTPSAGIGWLAAGDAAVRFDPLSAQGLLNALFTGLAAAEVADESLGGNELAWERYVRLVHGIEDSYRLHRERWYREETRWPTAPFWARRSSLHVVIAQSSLHKESLTGVR
jgi:flavin-dependent dehydrogenase